MHAPRSHGWSSADIDGSTYWFSPGVSAPQRRRSSTAHLLPNFDEYTVGYADRRPLMGANSEHLQARPELMLTHVVVVDGRVVGTWRRTMRTRTAHLAVTSFGALSKSAGAAIGAAATRYGTSHELAVEVERVAYEA